LEAELLKQSHLLEVAKKFNIATVEDLYAVLGDGAGLTPLQVIAKLRENALAKVEKERGKVSVTVKPWNGYGKPSQGVRVKGIENVMVRLSRCCNPLPGDPIVGYITRGRGVSIHREDCPNIIHHHKDEFERIIEVAWDTEAEAIYQVQIEAVAVDRPRLAMDIITTIADTKTTINAVNARATKNNLATVDLKIEIKSLDHLHHIMERIKKVKDVMEVKRITPHGNMGG
jgi:GTP pyrophosphokinase